MRGNAETGVDDNGDAGLGDDDFEKGAGLEAEVAADGSTERHDGGSAGFFELFAKDRIGVTIRKHDEAAFNKFARGEERLDRVGHEILRVGVDFEFQPVGVEGVAGEFGGEDGFLGVANAGGVREEAVAITVEVRENAVGHTIGAHAAEGDGDKLRAGGCDAGGHLGAGAVFAGAEEEAGAERDAGDDEGLGVHWAEEVAFHAAVNAAWLAATWLFT